MSAYDSGAAFLEAIGHYLDGLWASVGACPGCDECHLEADASDEDIQMAEEPNFSWGCCDSCGSSFGGDRHPAHAILDDGGILHLDICTDCLFFHAYGDIPETWDCSPAAYRERMETR